MNVAATLDHTVALPHRPPDPDAGLVLLAKNGCQRSHRALYERHSHRIHRAIVRYVKDTEDARDITQMVFAKAFRALPGFKGDSQFFTWLCRIAINTSKNWLAQLKRDKRVGAGAAASVVDPEADTHREELADDATPEAMLASRQIAQAVQDAVARLPAPLREALVMREIEGKEYAEIAAELDIPIGTVRSRIFRAREAVAKALAPLRTAVPQGRF